MDYLLSHLPVIFGASCFIAFCAIAWWFLLDLNARLKAKRAEARRQAAEAARHNQETDNNIDNKTE